MEANKLTTLLAQHLRYQERILWAGSPGQGIRFHSLDLYLVPFGILLLWYVFSPIFYVKNRGLALFDILVNPLLWIALYLVFGRFIYQAKKRSTAIYAITDMRLLALQGIWRRTLTTVDLVKVPEINECRHEDGTHTITFGRVSAQIGEKSPLKFEFIHDMEKLWSALEEAKRVTALRPNQTYHQESLEHK